MDLSPFIVSVFCLIDDRTKDLGRLRERGPAPTLCDSEVLTIEVVGEFLGIDEDPELFAYFRRHYAHYFPKDSVFVLLAEPSGLVSFEHPTKSGFYPFKHFESSVQPQPRGV